MTDGSLFAFGNTLEFLRRKVCGLCARGPSDGPPHNRVTGAGRVAACDGDYSDAYAKGKRVYLLVAETTGALDPGLVALLLHCRELATRRGGRDGTVYGQHRASTRAYLAHHVAEVATAVQAADAATLLCAAAASNFVLTLGDFVGAHRAPG